MPVRATIAAVSRVCPASGRAWVEDRRMRAVYLTGLLAMAGAVLPVTVWAHDCVVTGGYAQCDDG
ncbi:MAG TPA: hypothetical protein DCF45_03390, partial [Gammaproteobacteria bacterium]|nr:hypothetical protein [Gammaproteobacteria bacterium]